LDATLQTAVEDFSVHKISSVENTVTKLFGIKYPIIQAGMIWTSGWRLAAAASNAGCLGLIGSASMYPEVLRAHIRQCKLATDRPFGVNVALIYPQVEELMQIIIEEKVPIVFTSAGNPKTWTSHLKEHGIKVAHVVSSAAFASKAQDAKVDAVVAEGFEAGGHNGRDETTTLCLIPMVRQMLDIPLIAAGGIGTGRTMLAAFALGAEGVQVGSRFAASVESSMHEAFKQKIIDLKEGDTQLALKKLVPVRLVKNAFFKQVEEAESRGASAAELQEILGRARAKKGMFEGDLDEGELEIGQIAALFNSILTVDEIVIDLVKEFNQAQSELKGLLL